MCIVFTVSIWHLHFCSSAPPSIGMKFANLDLIDEELFESSKKEIYGVKQSGLLFLACFGERCQNTDCQPCEKCIPVRL